MSGGLRSLAGPMWVGGRAEKIDESLRAGNGGDRPLFQEVRSGLAPGQSAQREPADHAVGRNEHGANGRGGLLGAGFGRSKSVHLFAHVSAYAG